MDYGKAFRIARAIAGLQQRELAELARLNASHISLIEAGKREPSLGTVEKIAKALQIPEDLLLLLAAEPEDLKTRDPEDIQRAAQSLAQLLLRHASHSRFRRKLPLFANQA